MKRWDLPRRHGEHRAEMFEEPSGARGDTWSCGRRKGRNGDTVSETLTGRLPYPLLFVK